MRNEEQTTNGPSHLHSLVGRPRPSASGGVALLIHLHAAAPNPRQIGINLAGTKSRQRAINIIKSIISPSASETAQLFRVVLVSRGRPSNLLVVLPVQTKAPLPVSLEACLLEAARFGLKRASSSSCFKLQRTRRTRGREGSQSGSCLSVRTRPLVSCSWRAFFIYRPRLAASSELLLKSILAHSVSVRKRPRRTQTPT